MEIGRHTLRYFLEVAETLHFGHAADRLHISTPSLSQQIGRLEARVGEPLFSRTSRTVELTDAGRELVPLARAVVDAHAAIDGWAENRMRPTPPTLRIGFVVGIGGSLTARMIMAAAERIEGLRFEMQRLDFVSPLSALDDGRVDTVIMPDSVQAIPEGVEVSAVATERRVLVVSREHPFAGRDSITLAETSAETFITITGMSDERTDAWLVNPRPDGTRVALGSQADDVEGVIELCAAGLGVNIAGETARSFYSRSDVAFVPISDLEPMRLLLCTPIGTRNPAAREFSRIVRELFASEAL